jgi:hypothetical protein
VCCFLWCRKFFGGLGAFVAGIVVAVAPELVYFGARTLSEVVAGHLLVIALYVLEPGIRVTSRSRLAIGGAMLGLILVMRVQLAPALLVVAVWSGWRATRERLRSLLFGAAAVLLAVGLLDTVTLGYPLASLWRYVLYNTYYGVSSSFGVEPWSYYLAGEIGVWRGAIVPLLLLVSLGARRMPLLATTAFAILAFHSAIAHKEYRFIYPAIVLLMMLAGIGLGELVSWGTLWLRNHATERLASVVPAAAVAGWAALALFAWTGPTLAALRHLAHDTLSAASFVAHLPATCGIGLYGLGGNDWVAYGGYTYFHRPVPLYWPKDEAALTALAPGFDTLVSTGARPEGFQSEPLQCFGEVCVWHRSGGCSPLPMLAMPLPDPLAKSDAWRNGQADSHP